MQTILGAGGAVGIELAKSLKSYTNDIRLVSRKPQKVNETDTLCPADLLDREQLFYAVKGSDVVYLTVGLEYRTKVWQQAWPVLMQHVIDACIQYRAKLVFFDNVYMIGGDNVKHITEESPFSPTSKKGQVRSKLDRMILKHIELGKLQAIIARSADFYGSGDAKSILTELVFKKLSKGKNAQWLFNAKTKHSFTYIPDAGAATALLGNSKEAYNQIWHLPTDPNSLTGEEWITMIAEELGASNKYQLMSSSMINLLGLVVPFLGELYEMRYQYDRDYFFDSSKFQSHFNFVPTPYQEGVKEILSNIAVTLTA